MTKSQFLRLVEEVAQEPAGTLQGPELLENLGGWDSLAVVSFIAMVDEQLGMTLQPRAIADCKTVDDLFVLSQGTVTG